MHGGCRGASSASNLAELFVRDHSGAQRTGAVLVRDALSAEVKDNCACSVRRFSVGGARQPRITFPGVVRRDTRSKSPIIASRSSEPRPTRLEGDDRRSAHRNRFRVLRVSPRPRTSVQPVAVPHEFSGRMPRWVQLLSPATARSSRARAKGGELHARFVATLGGRTLPRPTSAFIEKPKPELSVPGFGNLAELGLSLHGNSFQVDKI